MEHRLLRWGPLLPCKMQWT